MSFADDVAAPMAEPRPTVEEQLAEILAILLDVRDRLPRSPQHLTGERHPRALLSESQVLEARALKRTGLSAKEVRSRLGLPTTVSATYAAISGRSWKHLSDHSSTAEATACP